MAIYRRPFRVGELALEPALEPALDRFGALRFSMSLRMGMGCARSVIHSNLVTDAMHPDGHESARARQTKRSARSNAAGG